MRIKTFSQYVRESRMEGGEDPAPTISLENKELIRNHLWNQLQSSDQLKSHLGLTPELTEHNFLDEVSHKIHYHFNPASKHMDFEFPGLGPKHNTTLDLGFSISPHTSDSHESDHKPLSLGAPHSSFNIGVKLPLSSIFGK